MKIASPRDEDIRPEIFVLSSPQWKHGPSRSKLLSRSLKDCPSFPPQAFRPTARDDLPNGVRDLHPFLRVGSPPGTKASKMWEPPSPEREEEVLQEFRDRSKDAPAMNRSDREEFYSSKKSYEQWLKSPHKNVKLFYVPPGEEEKHPWWAPKPKEADLGSPLGSAGGGARGAPGAAEVLAKGAAAPAGAGAAGAKKKAKGRAMSELVGECDQGWFLGSLMALDERT